MIGSPPVICLSDDSAPASSSSWEGSGKQLLLSSSANNDSDTDSAASAGRVSSGRKRRSVRVGRNGVEVHASAEKGGKQSALPTIMPPEVCAARLPGRFGPRSLLSRRSQVETFVLIQVDT